MKTVTELLQERRRVKDEMMNALEREYFVGKVVEWERGGHQQQGEIIVCSYWGERFKVRNFKTDKELWLSLEYFNKAYYEQA